MTDAVLPEEIIVNNIYSIRGHKECLGVCLAELYQLGARQLKQKVRGHPERFSDCFMFELTPEEQIVLRCQAFLVVLP